MSAVPPVRGVLFDLFHTLTAPESQWSDTTPTCDLVGVSRREWERVLHDTAEWRYRGHERDAREILRRLARHANPGLTEERIDEIFEIRQLRYLDIFARIPAANVAALRRLRRMGIRTALVSNADVMDVHAYPGCALCGLFDVEIFSCDVGLAKPEPAIYRLCLERLGLAAGDCAFVGDGGSDELRGAKAVGLRTVFVSGVIEELWPEQIPARAAIADHHVRWMPEALGALGIAMGEPA